MQWMRWRLELKAEKLRDRSSEQTVELNRNREEIADLKENVEAKTQYIAALEAERADLQQNLRETRHRLDDVSRRLQMAETLLEERAGRDRPAGRPADGGGQRIRRPAYRTCRA